MRYNLPQTALQTGVRLRLQYDGYNRTVEVHTVGELTTGHEAMRVFQVDGGSNSGESPGWKLLWLSKAQAMHLTDEVSGAPRPGYVRGDKAFRVIFVEV